MSNMEVSQKYIRDLGLVPHPEGGWFKVVHVSDDKIPSPYVDGKANRDTTRPLCSTIYYLLTPEELDLNEQDKPKKLPPRHRNNAGYFHTNNSATVHTWHSGKAVYTLIKVPELSGEPADSVEPQIKKVVMGDELESGETMVLVVPPGWWKRSETLSSQGHCLISETVTPAWVPQDHTFMSQSDLKSMCGKKLDMMRDFQPHVLPASHKLEFT